MGNLITVVANAWNDMYHTLWVRYQRWRYPPIKFDAVGVMGVLGTQHFPAGHFRLQRELEAARSSEERDGSRSRRGNSNKGGNANKSGNGNGNGDARDRSPTDYRRYFPDSDDDDDDDDMPQFGDDDIGRLGMGSCTYSRYRRYF